MSPEAARWECALFLALLYRSVYLDEALAYSAECCSWLAVEVSTWH